MLAVINAGSEPGSVTYMKEEDFASQFMKKSGDHTYCSNDDAVGWSKYGRMGSRWQVDNKMYVKVEKEGDDPFQYYAPPKPKDVTGSRVWGGGSSSSCGSSGSGGCGSGCSC